MISTKPSALIVFDKAEEWDVPALHEVATLAYFQTYFGAYSYAELKPYLRAFFSEEHLKKNIDEGLHEYFLVWFTGRPIGFSYVKRNCGFKQGVRISRKNSAELSKLYLLQRFTGKGIGTRFMEMMISYYCRENLSVLFSTAWSLNQKALRFYKKQGFEAIGEIDYEFAGKNNIDLILRKHLPFSSQRL